ncbi:MAG TPA: hypothetical protein VGW37_04175 [Terriglobia bacterium]|nr:hypothetical protein [Terriglobia bacterium]
MNLGPTTGFMTTPQSYLGNFNGAQLGCLNNSFQTCFQSVLQTNDTSLGHTAVYGALSLNNALGSISGAATEGDVYGSGAGNIFGMSGVFGFAEQDGAGTVTSMAALQAGPNVRTAGTVTTNYGLLVNPQTAGLTNYAIYTAGTAPSLFGGNVTVSGGTITGGTAGLTLDSGSGSVLVTDLNGILFVNHFPGADIGAKFNNACAALPPTGGTLYIEAGSYTATTQLVPCEGNVNVLGSGYGNGTNITSGLTGVPAESLVKIQDVSSIHFGFIKFLGTPSSGNLIFVNSSTATPLSHISFDHVVVNGSTGTGKDRNGASISAAGIYAANVNNVSFDHGSSFGNAQDFYFDNTGTSPVDALEIGTSQIESAIGDCVVFEGSGISTDVILFNDDIEKCSGKGINVTGGAGFSGLVLEGNQFENNNTLNASASIELNSVQGGDIHGGTVQCNTTPTVCLSAASQFNGTISGVGFTANSGTIGQLLSMKFLDATVQGNYFTTQAGATVTDQVKILTGSSGTRVGPNQYANAGTTTHALNDAVAGVTYAVGSTALDGLYLSNKPLMMSSGGSYIQQALSNTQLDIGANGTGPVNLNVFSGSGTGGVQVGDGAGNINTLIQGNGRLDLRNDLLIEQVGTIGSPTDSFDITGTPTANRTQALQDASDTFVYRGTTDTLSNKLLTTIGTASNCAVNSVSPAACGSAASGAFVVPTTTTTYTVDTTAVTAASRIFLFPMTFAGNLPSAPTCVTPATTNFPAITAISAGTSFTFSLTSTSGQTCWMYSIIN